MAELVWVLESYYGYSKKQISEILSQFLLCEGLEVEDLDLILTALEFYHGINIDFADAVLGSQALQKSSPFTFSFDQQLNRIPSITILPPDLAVFILSLYLLFQLSSSYLLRSVSRSLNPFFPFLYPCPFLSLDC